MSHTPENPATENTPAPHLEARQGDRKHLTPAAQRALTEAAERRAALDARAADLAATREIGGREGPDPVRYADWEFKGRAIDF